MTPLTFALVIAGSAALYALPGWAVVRLAWRGGRLSPAETLALALGVGITLPPLLIEASRVIGLRWSPLAVAVYLAVAVVALVAPGMRKPLRAPARPDAFALAALVALTLVAVVARLLAVRDLPAGLWGDSVHHTIMAQLVVDHGGLFSSWEPYAPLTTFTYHFGFHANVAFLHWLTGVPVEKAVIYSGQALNALAMPLAYLLVARLASFAPARARFEGLPAAAGLWAAAFVGFYNTLPAWLFNWGRYTQQLGQAVLVVVLVCWSAAIDHGARRPRGDAARAVALAAVATAGLMLTHYIVTLFAALLLAAYVVALIARRPEPRAMLGVIATAAAVSVVAVALALPWIANALGGYLVRNTGDLVTGQVEAARIASYASLGLVTPFFVKGPLLALAAAGAVIAMAQRSWRVVLLAVWSALFVLAVVPQAVGLPGAGVVDMGTGYMALYVTVGPLAGYAAGWVQTRLSAAMPGGAAGWVQTRLSAAMPGGAAGWVQTRLSAAMPGGAAGWAQTRLNAAVAGGAAESSQTRLSAAVAGARAHAPTVAGGAGLIALALFGASWQAVSADLNYQLLTPADARAMQWIKAETPAGARFLVNAFPAYGGTLVAGSDGGWWLTYLTGRGTNLPPLTYGSEKGPSVEWTFGVNRFAEALRRKPLTDLTPVRIDLTGPDLRALLRAGGYTHVYVGAHQNPPPSQADAIDPAPLRSHPGFRQVYAADGVEIFELAP